LSVFERSAERDGALKGGIMRKYKTEVQQDIAIKEFEEQSKNYVSDLDMERSILGIPGSRECFEKNTCLKCGVKVKPESRKERKDYLNTCLCSDCRKKAGISL
jgi:hypothetical protein